MEMVGSLRNLYAGGLSFAGGLVKEAKLHFRCVFGKKGKIDPFAIPGCAERIRGARISFCVQDFSVYNGRVEKNVPAYSRLSGTFWGGTDSTFMAHTGVLLRASCRSASLLAASCSGIS